MSILQSILIAMLRLSVPIVLMGLGNLYCERSGVMNLGAEGMMIAGAFCAVVGTYYTDNPWAGVFFGMAGSIIIAALLSLISVEFGGDQNISGLGLNTLAAGLASFFCRQLFSSGITPSVQNLQRTEILSGIPVIGGTLAQFSPLAYICIALIIVSAVIMRKTVLGMRITAVGDDPVAAETAGINVWNIRHLSVSVFCGICGGLAGAYLSIGQLSFFQDDLTNGKGMLAVIAVKMGRWDIKRMVLVALLFGFFDALQVQIQLNFPAISPELVQLIPYVVAIVVLTIAGEGESSPQAINKPYLKNRYKF